MPAKKGRPSKTHKGDLDYTTKMGDKYYHEGGHRVKKSHKPYRAPHLKIPMAGGGALKITICHDSDSDSDLEGEGLWDVVRGSFQSAADKAKNTINNVKNNAVDNYHRLETSATNTMNRIKDVANKVITGNTGMPPNVQKILDEYGSQLITKIDIVRNPVGAALVGALSIASLGQFGKNLADAPYDQLYHLKIIMTLQSGTKISLEKVERVNMVVNPKSVKDEEDMPASLNGKSITLNELYMNTQDAMGDRFYFYSSRDNNCQHFIMSVFQANGLGNQQDFDFIKQDTKELFGDNSFLRKASNTITDIGARFNVLKQGGEVDENQLDAAIKLMAKQKRSKRGLVATTAVPTTGGAVGKPIGKAIKPIIPISTVPVSTTGGKIKHITFTDFAKGWAKHHKITHGGALKSKHAKHVYSTIKDYIIKSGGGWDDFIQGAKKFFTGGYNDQIVQGLKDTGNAIKSGFDAFGNKITGTAEQIAQTVRSQADKIIDDAKHGISTSLEVVKNLANNVAITAEQKWQLLKAAAIKGYNVVKGGIMEGVNFVKKYGQEAINWIKDHEDAMKAIAISIAKFAVKKGIPLAGEYLGGIFADFLAAGMLQPELIPIAQTLGSMAGKKLGNMLSDYIMSLGLADAQGNPDADKWLTITGQAIDAGKMAYSGYQGLKAVNNYLSGAASAGQAATAAASTAGTGIVIYGMNGKKKGRPRKS